MVCFGFVNFTKHLHTTLDSEIIQLIKFWVHRTFENLCEKYFFFREIFFYLENMASIFWVLDDCLSLGAILDIKFAVQFLKLCSRYISWFHGAPRRGAAITILKIIICLTRISIRHTAITMADKEIMEFIIYAERCLNNDNFL